MNFSTLSKRMILPVTIVTVCSVLLFIACQKNNYKSIDAPNQLLSDAKEWFLSEVVGKEKELRVRTKSITSYDFRAFLRMEKISKLLNWDASGSSEVNGRSFVIVPLKEDITPFKNKKKQAFRNLVIYKNEKGKDRVMVVEVIAKGQTSLPADHRAIVRAAMRNYLGGFHESIADLNATVIFYDKHYQSVANFQFSDGNWAKSKTKMLNTHIPPGRERSATAEMNTCWECHTWYLVEFWYDLTTFEVVSADILSEEEVCNEVVNYVPYGDMGDGDPEDDPEEVPVGTDPCEIAKQLAKNQGFKQKMKDLKEMLDEEGETLYMMRKNSNDHIGYDGYFGGPSGQNFSFTNDDFENAVGMIHNHEINEDNLSIFSINDFLTLFGALRSTHVYNKESFTFGLVNMNGTGYLLAIDNLEQFAIFANSTLSANNPNQFNAFAYLYNSYINTENTEAENELGFLNLLESINGGTGLRLMKANSDFTDWDTLGKEDGEIVIIGCD